MSSPKPVKRKRRTAFKDLKQEASILDAITIEKTPDPSRARRYGARSKSTNPKLFRVGVCQFWCQLFELNEHLPPDQKMSDTEIGRQIITNYPGTKSAQQLENNTRTVGHYRALYNRGTITPGKIPPITPSYRYDHLGKPILTPGAGPGHTVQRVKKGASPPTFRTTLCPLPTPQPKTGRPRLNPPQPDPDIE